MSRPLLVTDCDEVLLHMVRHFRDWLDEAHDVDFALDGGSFVGALTRRGDGDVLGSAEVWPLLDDFFQTEMSRQTLVPGAREALEALSEVADIVVLTNLGDHCHSGRVRQLDWLGIRHRVLCNQGGKGRAVAGLVEELDPSVTVFVDDLPVHHESVARHAPRVWRLHMVMEPLVAAKIPPAPHAHARIDEWEAARRWIADRFAAGRPA